MAAAEDDMNHKGDETSVIRGNVLNDFMLKFDALRSSVTH